MRVIILLIAGLVVYLILRWLYQKNPSQFSKKVLYLGLIGLTVFLLIMALTGRLHWLFVLIAGLFPLIRRYLPLILRMLPILKTLQGMLNTKQTNGAASSGQRSSVQSHYFNMELNHDTGEISGRVIAGQYKARDLSELEINDFKILLHEVQADKNSLELLNTYLERRYGEDYLERFDFSSYQQSDNNTHDTHVNSSENEMSVKQAREVLGVDDTATREDVISAHRRLMQKFHPDRGGSNYLAAQINKAKQILLGE